MKRARKGCRKLTVYEARRYACKNLPMLRIQGQWLQELGFNIGDPVIVKCEDERLIITLDRERAEEKARVEAEQQRVHEELLRTNERRLMRLRQKIYEGFSEEQKRAYDGVAE